jgi:flagellar hook-associated protein 2
MGTVGLSIGTPASGTGFNFSATVTQIVSNLQNVETPRKNQLTKLQSQDTANQIMQELPTQLEGINQLYSAITGYNQNTNG